MTIQTGGKQILIHGLALVLAGLVWGFAPPLTPYPRLAVGAHIQFAASLSRIRCGPGDSRVGVADVAHGLVRGC